MIFKKCLFCDNYAISKILFILLVYSILISIYLYYNPFFVMAENVNILREMFIISFSIFGMFKYFTNDKYCSRCNKNIYVDSIDSF